MNFEPVPPPSAWADDPTAFLTANGLAPRSLVPVTSSALGLALSDPFGHYLHHMLGIANPFSYSPSLARGSYFHVLFENILRSPGAQEAALDGALHTRLAELSSFCDLWGLTSAESSDIAERERNDAALARAYFDAAMQITLPASSLGTAWSVRNFLAQPHLQTLGTEVTLVLGEGAARLVGTFDRIVLNLKTNQLWIVDLKTTSHEPSLRLSTVCREFQPQLYTYILRTLLQQNALPPSWDLTPSTVVGGFCHVVIQKPSITFDRRVDRPHNLVAHTLKSGPRKGLIEMRKEYLSDDPSHDLFVERAVRWMKGTGEYSDLGPAREMEPCVNASLYPTSSILDGLGTHQLNSRISACNAINNDPHPWLATHGAESLIGRGSLSPYAPFYLLPASAWPSIMSRNRLTQIHRYPSITSDTPSGVLTHVSHS